MSEAIQSDNSQTLEEEHLMIAEDLGLRGKMLKAVDPSQVESKVLGKSHHRIVTDAAATAETAQLFSQMAERTATEDPKLADFARDIARNLREER